MRRQILALLSLCFCMAICVADIVGPWHGMANIGMHKLPIVFNISKDNGEYSVTMDSPQQGAKGIPAEISVVDDTVKITIPMIGATYNGILSDNVIKGIFKQNGMQININLEPGEYVAPRPQTPIPPYPYETKEVTFINPADGYELHGTLTLPMQYMMSNNKKFNAVVMVTGSGTQNRDEEILGHKPFAVLAHNLAMNGIASLRYDDRGYGESDGDFSYITTEINASDAKEAIKYLRENVDKLNKTGVLGHSEGGTIAFILGADGDADFVVSLAGTAVKGDSILLKQNERILGQQLGEDLTQEYLKGLARTLAFMENNPGAKEWAGIDEALSDLTLPQSLTENLKQIISDRNAWLDYFITYDPKDAITRISVPVLALNGTLDMQVESEQNLGALRRLLPENPATVVKECIGLNHLMQEAETGLPGEYGEIEETISPSVIGDIIQWIKAQK